MASPPGDRAIAAATATALVLLGQALARQAVVGALPRRTSAARPGRAATANALARAAQGHHDKHAR